MPRVTLRTRKPIDQLTLSDLDAYPVWEYAMDEEGDERMDETWVRPLSQTRVPKRSYVHAAADLITATGKTFRGFVTVSTLTGPPQVTQGLLFRGKKGLFISNPEAVGARAARKALAVALGLKPRELFPIASARSRRWKREILRSGSAVTLGRSAVRAIDWPRKSPGRFSTPAKQA